MTDYDTILTAANALPIGDRARLIDDLWSGHVPGLSEAWREEVRRRSAELDRGEVQTVAWNVVRDAALQRAGLKHDD